MPKEKDAVAPPNAPEVSAVPEPAAATPVEEQETLPAILTLPSPAWAQPVGGTLEAPLDTVAPTVLDGATPEKLQAPAPAAPAAPAPAPEQVPAPAAPTPAAAPAPAAEQVPAPAAPAPAAAPAPEAEQVPAAPAPAAPAPAAEQVPAAPAPAAPAAEGSKVKHNADALQGVTVRRPDRTLELRGLQALSDQHLALQVHKEDKINWTTHKNQGMRLKRLMEESGEGKKFPHMRSMFSGTKEAT